MSSDSFKKFQSQVQQDESLKQEFRAAAGDGGMAVEKLVDFAAGKGYDFKVEDVSGELSDQQLESVAGGGDPAASQFYKMTSDHKMPINEFLKIEGSRAFLSPLGTSMGKI